MSAWGFDTPSLDNEGEEQRTWLHGEVEHGDWAFNGLGLDNLAWGAFPVDSEWLNPSTASHENNHENNPSRALSPPQPLLYSDQQLPSHPHTSHFWETIANGDEDEQDDPRQRPSTSFSNSPPAEFVTLEDTTDEEVDDMPAATHSRRSHRNNTARSSVLDLTSTSSSGANSQARGTKRRRSTDGGGDRASKQSIRRKRNDEIEQLDLTNEAPSADEELLQQQQKEAIHAQQEQANRDLQKIGQRQCIICMENYTNATATACGHFYCHECLVRAVIAGERNSDRGTGTCPVCRTPISRRKKYDIIPMSFMKKSQFTKNQSKRTNLSS